MNEDNPDEIHLVSLNQSLVERQGLSPERVTAIEQVTQQLKIFLKRHSMYASPEEAVRIVEGYEYVLQGLWGFNYDFKMHKYWNELEGCTCPYYDNKELRGTILRSWDANCPFHGTKQEE